MLVFLLIVGTAGVAALYLGLCAVSPYGRCRRCRGLGRQRTRGGRTVRNCRPCDGTGKALRLGARLLAAVRR